MMYNTANKTFSATLLALLSSLALFACGGSEKASESAAEAAPQASHAASATPETDAAFEAALKTSFRPNGQAEMDRLQRNDMQRACSRPDNPAADISQAIMQSAKDRVTFPADGNFLGDWKAGKALAGIGTGMQYSDDPAKPNGGNCYACHQLEEAEIAYGTIGPSLKQYGKLRGQSKEMLEFTWTRIYNPHAFNPCSHMPRFGDAGILTEQQLKDVMALLFDPESPVNQ